MKQIEFDVLWGFAGALLLCAALVVMLKTGASRVGLLDTPGGRKDHSHAVPLVGGLAIFLSLLLSTLCFGLIQRTPYLLLCLAMVVAVGTWDDFREIRPRIKFAIQIVAAATMIWGGDVELRSLGDLIGWRSIGLSFLAIPLTIFAVVGVVNSINMMDGMDGLAGSVSFISFSWFALIAARSDIQILLAIAVLLCGALAGFLLFNLRLPWQRQAQVFLGDAGSLMLGFALAWFAIDLTQGPGRSLPPIVAIWILLLPLADCVSLMTRRLTRGRSPFVADREHIHHYLLARGFTPSQTLAILAGCSTLFGAVGYVAWRLALPEAALFWTFFIAYFAYHTWVKWAWKGIAADSQARDDAP